MFSTKNVKSARYLAVKLLTGVETSHQYIDHLLETSADYAMLSSNDRALLTEITHGVLRHRNFLDLIISHYIRKGYPSSAILLKNILRISLYQLIFLHKTPDYAVVSAAVDMSKTLLDEKRARFVNAVLRNYLRNPYEPDHPDADDLQALSTYYSHPVWLIQRFVRQFGQDELIEWMKANNRHPQIFLRALAPMQESHHNALSRFEDVQGYYGLLPGKKLADISGWKEGLFIVQDPSAGLAIELLQVQPGETLIDLCAAPGGKTIALAKIAGRQGRITAVDISKIRMKKLQQNLERNRIKNVQSVLADARKVSLAAADAVLVDAPCSGLGVLCRRSDLRWNRKPKDIPVLIQLQSEILANASRMVKSGGRLIYSTCTIDREENEDQVYHFLEKHAEFEIESAQLFVNKPFVTSEGFVKTFPHRHHIDGTFAARLRYKG